MDSIPTGHIVVWEGASLIQVKSHYTEFPRTQSGGGTRNKVSGFSAASRKRMMVLLNKIREDALRKSKLITLTYHRTHVEKEEIKRNFKAFRQALRRHKPDSSCIWKLEYQERGSPHFHLLYFGRFIQHQWIARTWTRIAEPGDPLHLKAGTQIASCRHAKSAGSYLTKYMGKLSGCGAAAGSEGIRHWGVINRDGLPYGSRRVIPCSGGKARDIIEQECAKRSLGTHGSNVGSIDLFLRNSRSVRSWIDSVKTTPDIMEEWNQP